MERPGKKNTLYIIVTGGVISGLGKGIVAASISALLSSKYRVANLKWDGYHNHNPGTMNPREHGEVFVCDDGAEVDLDFGHYERFTGQRACGDQSITRGKLSEQILKDEMEGRKYEGRTIQEIPHVRDALVDRIIEVGKMQNADVVVLEVGGTVGDDEARLALHAARQLEQIHGKEHVLYVHVAPVFPTFDSAKPQYKTKPIQMSLRQLMMDGMYEPDILVVRTPGEGLSDDSRKKICDSSRLRFENIIEGRKVPTVYRVPMEFLKQGLHDLMAKHFRINVPGLKDEWCRRVQNIETPRDTIRIALCGKYMEDGDSYISVREALVHAGAAHGIGIQLDMFDTDSGMSDARLQEYDGVIVPGGYGSRGVEGKIDAIRLARENEIPYLGLCYGMQLAVVEFARNVCGLSGAHTTEVNEQTPHRVVEILPEQRSITKRSGTQRLGAQEARLLPGTIVHELYGKEIVSERHRHRYEINPDYHEQLLRQGLVISGRHKDCTHIAEFIELPRKAHPFFVATQAHPELKSTLLEPAPLFQGFVDAACKRKELRAAITSVDPKRAAPVKEKAREPPRGKPRVAQPIPGLVGR